MFGPVFRYFDVLDRIDGAAILTDLPRIAAWRARLRERPSVRDAVAPDYAERLTGFLLARRSALSHRLAA